jgi:hypothetical protein
MVLCQKQLRAHGDRVCVMLRSKRFPQWILPARSDPREVFERRIVRELFFPRVVFPARSSSEVMLTWSIPARSSSEVEKQAGDEGWKLKTRASSLREACPREVWKLNIIASSSPEVPESLVSAREPRSRRAEGAARLDTQRERRHSREVFERSRGKASGVGGLEA